MTSLTKNLKHKNQTFFSLQTERLAKSFHGLNSSLALLAPELCPCKDMCNRLILHELLGLTWQWRLKVLNIQTYKRIRL